MRTAALGGLLALASFSTALAASQRHFESANAAAIAVVNAAKAHDTATIDEIFGPNAREMLRSGDDVADQEAREDFVARAEERVHLEPVGDDFAVLSVGNDYWPFPIPLVKEKSGWRFDVEAGKTEMLNRRIGRNELYAINVAQEYVAAQREYARRRQAETGVSEFAQRIRSTPGQRDGLYWETGDGEDESPMGPLVASASREGYRAGGADEGEPYHGYVYKIFTAQGPNAPGGARSYIKDGRMTEGFALVAYPVRYGASGIMTFQVNQQGVVFQKDLGPRTAKIVAGVSAYDPDESWDPTE
jgi:hypothetical protein